VERSGEVALRRVREPLFYLVLLSLWFCCLYGSSDWLALKMPYRISMGQPDWPFLPHWAPVYLSLNLLLIAGFWLSKRRAELFTALLLQTLVAWPLFVFLPLQPIVLPRKPESLWFGLADTVNLHANYLPSLHVAYAVTCAIVLRRSWILLWVLAISAATVLTYQHYPVDVLVGALLAGAAVWWSTGPGKPFSLCLGELVRCSARHRRYALISIGLLGYLLARPRAGWKALVGFCYLQRVDDVLDGHLDCEEEPQDFAQDQVLKWQSGDFDDSSMDTLAKALFRALPQTEKIVAIIEEMIIDRKRVRERELLCEKELKAHLERTFGLSLDLMLLAAGVELRSDDLTPLLPLLGWCSVVRDLEEDLKLGLINVPRESVENQDIEDWFGREFKRAQRLFDETDAVLKGLRGKSGHGLLKLFHRSVRKYLRSHQPSVAAESVSKKLSTPGWTFQDSKP
jgi:membrane-associated phospholipid phosphatase